MKGLCACLRRLSCTVDFHYELLGHELMTIFNRRRKIQSKELHVQELWTPSFLRVFD